MKGSSPKIKIDTARRLPLNRTSMTSEQQSARALILEACGYNMSDPLVAKTVLKEFCEMPISVSNRVDAFINDELRQKSMIHPIKVDSSLSDHKARELKTQLWQHQLEVYDNQKMQQLYKPLNPKVPYPNKGSSVTAYGFVKDKPSLA